MNCALMFTMSDNHGRKCFIDLLQFEPCSMSNVISDLITLVSHDETCNSNTILQRKENKLSIDVCHEQSLWKKCLNVLIQLKSCVMICLK